MVRHREFVGLKGTGLVFVSVGADFGFWRDARSVEDDRVLV